MPATIELVNSGTEPLDLALDARTSHYGWSVALDQADVSVAAGASVQVPATIVVATGRVGGHPRPRHRPRARHLRAPR